LNGKENIVKNGWYETDGVFLHYFPKPAKGKDSKTSCDLWMNPLKFRAISFMEGDKELIECCLDCKRKTINVYCMDGGQFV
jgi:hypothetical protein